MQGQDADIVGSEMKRGSLQNDTRSVAGAHSSAMMLALSKQPQSSLPGSMGVAGPPASSTATSATHCRHIGSGLK